MKKYHYMAMLGLQPGEIRFVPVTRQTLREAAHWADLPMIDEYPPHRWEYFFMGDAPFDTSNVLSWCQERFGLCHQGDRRDVGRRWFAMSDCIGIGFEAENDAIEFKLRWV